MAFMTPADWQRYEDVINEWQGDAFQQTITWKKRATTVDPNGEDSNVRYEEEELKGLIHYNHFRSWPLTGYTETGELDKQNCMVFFNIAYLQSLGYALDEGKFEFEQAFDRFIVNNIEYQAAGDSQAAQAHEKPLFIFIVLKRTDQPTGSKTYR